MCEDWQHFLNCKLDSVPRQRVLEMPVMKNENVCVSSVTHISSWNSDYFEI